ncbi:hypothetical protein L1887_58270 [Cichorium endivia]|nr:hypothetical protein L1887_58270 [Cichorium endivia]
MVIAVPLRCAKRTWVLRNGDRNPQQGSGDDLCGRACCENTDYKLRLRSYIAPEKRAPSVPMRRSSCVEVLQVRAQTATAMLDAGCWMLEAEGWMRVCRHT